MQQNLVRKETIVKERWELEFRVVTPSEIEAKMKAIDELLDWMFSTNRQPVKMPRMDQIKAKQILGVMYEDGNLYKVEFDVDTESYTKNLENYLRSNKS